MQEVKRGQQNTEIQNRLIFHFYEASGLSSYKLSNCFTQIYFTLVCKNYLFSLLFILGPFFANEAQESGVQKVINNSVRCFTASCVRQACTVCFKCKILELVMSHVAHVAYAAICQQS